MLVSALHPCINTLTLSSPVGNLHRSCFCNQCLRASESHFSSSTSVFALALNYAANSCHHAHDSLVHRSQVGCWLQLGVLCCVLSALVWAFCVAESVPALQCEPCKILWACSGQSYFPSVLDLLGGSLGWSHLRCCHLPKLQSQGEIFRIAQQSVQLIPWGLLWELYAVVS